MFNFKICGVTNMEIANLLDNNKCDMVGFCCVESSPRHINAYDAYVISKSLEYSKSVILYQNEKLETVVSDLQKYPFDYVQLHGDESVEYIKSLKNSVNIKVIKAISVEDKDSLKVLKDYDGVADILLFDTKINSGSNNGGHGVNFDWSLVYNIDTNSTKMIAGGLNINNIDKCYESSNINFFDLSSGVEKTKGIKDKNMIENLLLKYKNGEI